MTRTLLFGVCATFLVAPVCAVLLFSLSPSTAMDFYHRWPPSARWWLTLVQDHRWFDAFMTSFLIGVLSSSIGLCVALPAAAFGRITGSPFAKWVLLIARAPVCIPPVVLAVGLYQVFSRVGLFDTIIGLSLAHVAFTVAAAIFILSARFDAEPLGLYQVARSLGASPVHAALTWLRATQRATIVSCFAAGLLISMSEVTVTLYVTDTKVVTISRLVLSGITRDVNPTGFAAMATWLIVLGACLLFVAPKVAPAFDR